MVVSSSRPSSRCCWRRNLEEGRELRAGSAPSQQHQLRRKQQQTTAVSLDDERSTGAFVLKVCRTAARQTNIQTSCYSVVSTPQARRLNEKNNSHRVSDTQLFPFAYLLDREVLSDTSSGRGTISKEEPPSTAHRRGTLLPPASAAATELMLLRRS